jgi:hypothetical protein
LDSCGTQAEGQAWEACQHVNRSPRD